MPKKSKREGKAAKAIKEEVTLSLTPMIDVTFLILIFFMCTLRFKTLEGKLVSYLPTNKGLSNAQAEVEFEDAEIIIQVPKADSQRGDTDKDNWRRPPMERTVVFKRSGINEPFGRSVGVRVDPQNPKITSFKLSPPDTFDLIRKYLKEVREKAPESKAKINAYARTPHIYVVSVLNMIMEADFTEITYSGIPNTLLSDLADVDNRVKEGLLR